jgi:hypothetical protein
MLSALDSISRLDEGGSRMRMIARLLIVILLLCSLSVHGQSKSENAPSVPPGGALILDVSGTLEVRGPGGDKVSAKRDTALTEGTMIETGREAKVLLRLDDGSEVLLVSRSSLLLKRAYQQSGMSLFQLLFGMLRAVVTKRYTGTPSFQLGTPTAIVAVRGTRFYVEVNSHEVTEVDVEQGTVQVTSLKDPDDFVLVKPGFSTRVGPDMIPEVPSPTDNIRPDLREQQETEHQGAPDPVESRQPPPPQPSQPNQQDTSGPNGIK